MGVGGLLIYGGIYGPPDRSVISDMYLSLLTVFHGTQDICLSSGRLAAIAVHPSALLAVAPQARSLLRRLRPVAQSERGAL